ncbi:MAG: ATP-binding protein [Desulfitobacteriia bacterium]|jgi:sensor histidine kinase regulating citrate/malate metabolism
MRKRFLTLKTQVFLLAFFCGLIPFFLAIVFLYTNFTNFFEVHLEKEALEIALGAAENERVKKAFTSEKPDTRLLQAISNEYKNQTGSYVIFIDMTGTALIDPYPIHVHTQVIGEDREMILKGEAYTSRSSAYSTPSIRAFAPVMSNNQQIGAVVAAFLEPDIKLILRELYQSVYKIIPFALLLILILSLFLANNIKKRLFGMEPDEIGTRLIEREGILHSVKEGIIGTDYNLKITVVNNSAAELFPKNTQLLGRKITDLIADSPLPKIIQTKKPEYNKQLLINEKIVISNSFPIFIKDKFVGTVMTFSGLDEANLLAEELTGVKKIMEALRARTHEFSNKLHVISGLLQLGSIEEARKYVTSVVITESGLIGCLLNNFQVNAVSGLLMGKASEAEEQRIKFTIAPDSCLFSLPEYYDEHAIIVVLGNLIENAFYAVTNLENPEVIVSIKQTDTAIQIKVSDNGRGIPEKYRDLIFEPGFTTKEDGTGYGLYNVISRVNVAKGEISFTSNEKGTTFMVHIPYDAILDEEQGGSAEWN